MNTRIDEIADDIYRLSSFVPGIGPTGFTFNQYADRPPMPSLPNSAMAPKLYTTSPTTTTAGPLKTLEAERELFGTAVIPG